MTAGEFDQLVEALPEQARAAARGPNKRQFAEQLVRIKILSQEARKRKIDETPAVQQQIELQKESLLANALFQDMTANVKVDEATERQYYEEHKSEYETVHARHILIRMKGSPLTQRAGKQELTEAEALVKAQDLRKKLLADGDFAALAKVESDDATSGANAGDLVSFKHGQLVAEFDQSGFSLPVEAKQSTKAMERDQEQPERDKNHSSIDRRGDSPVLGRGNIGITVDHSLNLGL